MRSGRGMRMAPPPPTPGEGWGGGAFFSRHERREYAQTPHPALSPSTGRGEEAFSPIGSGLRLHLERGLHRLGWEPLVIVELPRQRETLLAGRWIVQAQGRQQDELLARQ